jgi:hypothetical protein
MQAGQLFEVLPMTKIEVVPGDSMFGKIQVKFRSDALLFPVFNSTILSYHLYYVPHRQSWDGFPEFIAEGVGTVPTSSSSAPRFFERATGGGTKNTLYREAYKEIWNEYFRHPDDAESTGTLVPLLAQRVRSYETIFSDEIRDDETIDTSGATVTAREVRTAMARDRFLKRRERYGEKYSDYLRALGSSPQWSELDVPELLGEQYKRVNNDIVFDTGASIGVPSSIFQGSCTFNVKTKFFDEHGYVVGVLVVRPRVFNIDFGGDPSTFKTDRYDFYSPELVGEGQHFGTNYVIKQGHAPANNLVQNKFDEYRYPMDQYVNTGTNDWAMSWLPPNSTPAGARNVSPSHFTQFFRNNLGNNMHYHAHCYHDITLKRPIPRAR